MTDYVLTIPADVYDRAQQIAQENSLNVDQVLLDHLKTLSTSLSRLPLDEQAEIMALKSLSNDALWTIASEQMPDDVQARMQVLMDSNSLGTITDEEYRELEALVERGNRLMLRKAEATGNLMDRGHRFTQKDFLPRNE